MQFTSYEYILIFLPCSIILYFLCNRISVTLGKMEIILASAVFYSYVDWKLSIVLWSSLAINYLFSRLLCKKSKLHRIFLIFPLIINIGGLLLFKYADFAIKNINDFLSADFSLLELALPLGISFFTFQQIAYIVAVFKGELSEISLLDYLVYIMFFPKILMGPLMDPIEFISQINDENRKRVDWDNIACGIKIFSFGLFKKALIADMLSDAVSWGFSNVDKARSLDLIFVALFFTFEIYFDFSGYSDMATGSALMLNIELPINFNSPYKALSTKDFWNRWHISLNKFFTKYIYIPLGGSRNGRIRTYTNILIVFLVSGLWHGANWTFILWGGIQGVLIIIDRVLEKIETHTPKIIRWLFTFGFINISFLLFRSDSVEQWVQIMKKILSFAELHISDGLIAAFSFPERELIKDIFHIRNLAEGIRGFWTYLFVPVLGLICFIPENNYNRRKQLTVSSVILASIAFVCLGNESMFVYLNF